MATEDHMATPFQRPFSLGAPPTSQDNSLELDRRIVNSGIENIIQNISNLHLDETQSTFSDLDINRCIQNIQEKVIETLEQLDQISGKINAFITYWKISDVPSEVQDLINDIKLYKKTLESYPSKMKRIKGSSENLYLLLKRILGIQIPQMADIRFPPPISLTDIVIKSILERKITQPGENLAELAIRELGNHLAKCHAYHNVIMSASYIIANVATDFGSAAWDKYKSWSDAENAITQIRLKFIECSLKEKLERITRSLRQAITENQSTTKIAIEQSLSQVKESIKSCKENDPFKSDMDLVKEMSESPLCAGLVLPMMNSCNCSSQLAWTLIQEQFRRPRSHSAV